MSELKPKHTHDCEDCHFLGSFSYATTDSLDLYKCGAGPFITLISRYGSRGMNIRVSTVTRLNGVILMTALYGANP